MSKVIIYSTASCPYCVQAKRLLDHKGITYQEIRVDQDSEKLAEMIERSEGRRSVPQIFINGRGIGGFTDLRTLEEAGKLDVLSTSFD